MFYITIDGDDVGQKITAAYLNNDIESLNRINHLVYEKTHLIASYLSEQGFSIMFCAADGVAGFIDTLSINQTSLFNEITNLVGNEITFSIGTGKSMRESYIALLAAKSNGKKQLFNYSNLN